MAGRETQRVFKQQSLGLMDVEKKRDHNMTVRDRKGTQKTSNTPLSALIKCCVINESLASSMKNSASVRNSCSSLMKQKWDQQFF